MACTLTSSASNVWIDFDKILCLQLIAATPAAAPEQPRPKKQKTAAKGQQQKEPVAITAGASQGIAHGLKRMSGSLTIAILLT